MGFNSGLKGLSNLIKPTLYDWSENMLFSLHCSDRSSAKVEEYERLLLKKTLFAKGDEVSSWKWSLIVSCTNIYNLNDDQKCWAQMEMLGIMREAKNMVFQPQYVQCFTATTSLQQTHDYNF
jgi:hypothetical protein